MQTLLEPRDSAAVVQQKRPEETLNKWMCRVPVKFYLQTLKFEFHVTSTATKHSSSFDFFFPTNI